MAKVSLTTFTDDTDQVETLIKWWASRSDARYHSIRKHGTLSDFINDVWVRILSGFRDGREVECSVSTAVIKSCHWELVSYQRIGDKNSWERRGRLRSAVSVREDHLVQTDEYLVEHVFYKELTSEVAKQMRTLAWREAVTIRARYGLFGDDHMSLEQVGKALKISRERVRQIESKGINKLRHHERAKPLLQFIEIKDCADDVTDVEDCADDVKKRLEKTKCGRVLLEEIFESDD